MWRLVKSWGLLSALRWVHELHNMDFEMDCKSSVDRLYSNRMYTSDLGAIYPKLL
jgi:histone acetyltransferase (RNA polymerase elongator complex component)